MSELVNQLMNERNLLNHEDLVIILGMTALISHSPEMRAYSLFTFLYKEPKTATQKFSGPYSPSQRGSLATTS